MTVNSLPIGVFDSGLGGVSVLRESLRLLPDESYIYYGDNLHAPYGDKPEAEITALTLSAADYLVSRGVKAILIACNTATATCINEIRSRFSLPVISVEPAIKPACEAPGDGKILMLATLATTKLERYLTLQSRMIKPERVINVPCSGLVDRIERGVFAPDAFDDILHERLSPYEGMTIDGIVLGCTHYIFIKDAIKQYARAHFRGEPRIYDGNAATARQLAHVLEQNSLLGKSGGGRVEFITSGDRDRLLPIFQMLLQLDMPDSEKHTLIGKDYSF